MIYGSETEFIVGLIVHLGVLFYILGYGCYQVMFRLRDKQLRGLTAGLTAGVFGIAVCSYSNEIFGQFPTGIIMYAGRTLYLHSLRASAGNWRKRMKNGSNTNTNTSMKP